MRTCESEHGLTEAVAYPILQYFSGFPACTLPPTDEVNVTKKWCSGCGAAALLVLGCAGTSALVCTSTDSQPPSLVTRSIGLVLNWLGLPNADAQPEAGVGGITMGVPGWQWRAVGIRAHVEE